MTKKDYILFARLLTTYPEGVKIDKADLILALSDLFYQNNCAFDRERFEAACKGSK
jgi:hypothetical protein